MGERLPLPDANVDAIVCASKLFSCDRSHNLQVSNLLLSVEQTQQQISCTHQNNPSTRTPWMSEIYCFASYDVDHTVQICALSSHGCHYAQAISIFRAQNNDPAPNYLRQTAMTGRKCTWAKLSAIQASCSIELMLDEIISSLSRFKHRDLSCTSREDNYPSILLKNIPADPTDPAVNST